MGSWFNKLRGDKVIWSILFLLTIVSVLIVYSATGSLAYRQRGGNTSHYLLKHLLFMGVGFGVMWFITRYVSTRLLSSISFVLLVLSFLLLGLAQVLNMGSEEGTGRTINLGSLSFQPAEMAKISLILFVSRLLSSSQTEEDRPTKKTFWWILIASGLICGVIMLSNFSTALLLFLSVVGLMLMGRVNWRYIAGIGVVGIFSIVAIYFLAPKFEVGRFNTVRGRIERFINGDPESQAGMTQADYAKLAIYRGGQIGNGPGGSEVRNHMAAAFSDYIFAILVEEYGWISFVVIILYFILAMRAGIIIKNSKRSFQAFMVGGFTMLIMLQAITNMAVSCGLFPVTGQPLPWISLGGTSTLFTACIFGMILRASYQNTLDPEKEKEERKVEAEDYQEEIPDEDLAFRS